MDILDSSLSRDIKDILNSDPQNNNSYWTIQIHCGTQDDTVESIKVLSIDFICDFERNFADEIILRCVIGGGAYAYHVYPNLDQLEITLHQVPVYEVGGGVDTDDATVSQRYIATLLNPFNPAVESNAMNQPDETSLDLTNLLEIDFQLIPKQVNQFRMRTYGGIFRNQTVEDVIKHVLTSESANVDVDSDAVPKGVEMVAANNKTARDHIVIPQGTKLVKVPDYIHEKCGGVYNAGLAAYFSGDHWYVFPPYNNANFDSTPRTMTIINVPPNRMPAIEQTYKKEGNNLTVLATGDTKLKNFSEDLVMNHGNGVRFGDADKFMENYSKLGDNKAVAGRGGTNSEFTTIKRDNGLNNVMQAANRINSNPFWEYSKLAARDGSIISLSWENSDMTQIYPGMPVKILFMQDDDISSITGLLIKAHHYVNTFGSGFQTNRHFTTSNLMIFCKRVVDLSSDDTNA
jgi:hypothetical protein